MRNAVELQYNERREQILEERREAEAEVENAQNE